MINPYQQQLIMHQSSAATPSAPPSFNMVTGAPKESSLWDSFTEFFGDPTNQQILQGAGAVGLLGTAYSQLGDIGQQGLGLGQELAQTQLGQTAFTPYTFTTATGGQYQAGIDPATGQLLTSMALSPQEQALQQQLQGGAGGFFAQAMQDPAQREMAVYERMRAAMAPEEQRQQLALEERLANQGRLGVRTNLFGGTPEQFALSKAQEEAKYGAMLQAMGQAQAEQAQQAALGQQYLAGSYVPQAQLLSAFQPGLTSAAAQQQAQLYGAGLFGEATASGIDALLGSALGQANLFGAAGTGLLAGLVGA